MRLKNNSNDIRYSSLAKTSINPGRLSRELPDLLNAIQSVISKTKGFEILLSDSDIDCIIELFNKYIAPIIDGGPQEEDKNNEYYDDPTGIKHIKDRIIAYRKARQHKIDQELDIIREREKKIQDESNFIDEKGLPVGKTMVDQTLDKDIKPVEHKEMSTDLKSILENNLAIIQSEPDLLITKNTVIASPNGRKVSTNPKDYQKSNQTASNTTTSN